MKSIIERASKPDRPLARSNAPDRFWVRAPNRELDRVGRWLLSNLKKLRKEARLVPILFDTGAVELLRRRNRRAEKLAIDFYPPMLCTAVVGEFLFGQVFANVSSATLLEAKEFLESFEVLTPDTQTAAIYGNASVTAGIARTS